MDFEMKHLFVFVAAFSLLTGCATVRESFAPDGRKAYSLNCSGAARGWDKCLTSAGELCGKNGYDILDRSSESMMVGSFGGGASMNRSSGSASSSGFIGSTSERSMMIACKVPS
jgi:hypothetical protein